MCKGPDDRFYLFNCNGSESVADANIQQAEVLEMHLLTRIIHDERELRESPIHDRGISLVISAVVQMSLIRSRIQESLASVGMLR